MDILRGFIKQKGCDRKKGGDVGTFQGLKSCQEILFSAVARGWEVGVGKKQLTLINGFMEASMKTFGLQGKCF